MSDESLRAALEKLITDNVVVDRRPRDKHGPIGRLPEARIPTSTLQDLLAAHPAEPVPVADRERVAEDDDALPGLYDDTRTLSIRGSINHEVAVKLGDEETFFTWVEDLAAMVERASYEAGVFRSEAVALDREAVEIAARAKIAEWYGTEWNARDDRFYETDDGGATGDEDSEAMLELRGARLALDEAAKLARPEAVVKAEAAERIAQAIEDYQHALEDAFEKRGHEADEIRADAAENCATIARQFGPGRADEMEEES